jgi:hypothetical protein
MVSTFTTNKSIEKPGNGDYVDTWSTPVNADFDIIDQAFGGVTNLNAAAGNATLTSTQYRSLVLNVTGTIASAVTYTIPAGIGGQWIVINGTTGGFGVIIASAGGGTSYTVTNGNRMIVFSDGTNIRTSFSESAIPSPSIPAGAVMLFQSTNAPNGWTKSTTHDNKALRVVSGNASTGGSVAFTTAFASQTPTGNLSITGSVGATTLTVDQIPSHTHTQAVGTLNQNSIQQTEGGTGYNSGQTGATGGGQSHTHSFTGGGTFTGAAINLAVQYVDVIFATKD